jgi:hypothetical protein
MHPPVSDLPPHLAAVLEVGVALGQSRTFALVSGRCSAAHAEALLRLRDSKQYLSVAKSWKEFCPAFLHISSITADRVIRCWQQFGAGFFELQKLINISPEFYRSIESSIKDGALHFNGEAIELDPANSEKVAATVAELRRTMPPKAPPPPPTLDERLSGLDQRSEALIAEFSEIAGLLCQSTEKSRFESALNRASAALQRLEMELGVH